jgi:hypothetical protein
MRKVTTAFAVLTTVLIVGSVPLQVDAQTMRGTDAAATIRNFTPIEKAACGPHWGPLVWSMASPGVRSVSVLVCSLLVTTPVVRSQGARLSKEARPSLQWGAACPLHPDVAVPPG